MFTPGVNEEVAATYTVVPKRVALLTNILLRHNVAVLEALKPHLREFRVFLSAQNEPDRKMPVHWGNLDVVLQKSIRWSQKFDNVYGYKDVSHIQVPYDTLSQLWSYKPDVLISGQFGGRSMFAALYKILRPHTKLIIWATLSQRTEATRGGLRRRVRRWILRKADACFTHGVDGEIYLRNLGFTGPVFFTPYVIESGIYEGKSTVPDDEVVRVLYTGQLIERKAIYPFTEALCAWCRQHPERRVRFTVGGDGPEKSRLEALDRPDNLDMQLVGHLDLQAIVLAYRNASVYVFPTLGDEWGMVVNEALSAGVPILASEHAQSSLELVKEGINGWIFDPSDPKSLADGIDRALSTDRATLAIMSRQARASVARWTPKAMAERMAEGVRAVCE